jgi:hypothetical protein
MDEHEDDIRKYCSTAIPRIAGLLECWMDGQSRDKHGDGFGIQNSHLINFTLAFCNSLTANDPIFHQSINPHPMGCLWNCSNRETQRGRGGSLACEDKKKTGSPEVSSLDCLS